MNSCQTVPCLDGDRYVVIAAAAQNFDVRLTVAMTAVSELVFARQQ